MTHPLVRILSTVVLLVAFVGGARAHSVGISRGDYAADADSLRAHLTFARPELVATVPALDADGDGAISATELRDSRDALAATVVEGIEVRDAGGTQCPGALADSLLTEQDGVDLVIDYRCASAGAGYSVRMPLLTQLSVGHRHLATVTGTAGTKVLFEHSAELLVPVAASATAQDGGGVAWPMFVLGVEHILTGYDHLLFLLGLILVGGTLRALLVVVTAFTVAHSITLGLAAFDVYAPSPALVEPLIALSIVYVGIENFFVKDASRRWRLTLPFGLIHGFGFAGALRDVALPQADISVALLTFNLGVEAGQVAVLAIVLPVLARLRRKPGFVPNGVRAASALIALAGAAWFVQRIA